jgi:hypothetical protein
MYEHHFHPEKTGGVSTFTVVVTDKLPEYEKVVVSPIVLTYAVIDWQRSELLPGENLLSYLLEICHMAMLERVKEENWNPQPFIDAFSQVKENRFLYRTHFGKNVLSPDKQHKAQVYFEYDYEKSGTYLDISDKAGNLIRRVLFSPSGYAVICKTVGKPTWIDPHQISIPYINNTRCSWLIDIDGTVDFLDDKALEHDPHALYQLGLLYFEGAVVLKDLTKGLALIREAAVLGYKHAQKWLARYEEK